MVLNFRFKYILKCRLQFVSIWTSVKFLSSSNRLTPPPTHTHTHTPDDNILAMSKLKAFEDDKLDVTQNIYFFFHMVENIV